MDIIRDILSVTLLLAWMGVSIAWYREAIAGANSAILKRRARLYQAMRLLTPVLMLLGSLLVLFGAPHAALLDWIAIGVAIFVAGIADRIFRDLRAARTAVTEQRD